jgi:hypothetical protein
MQEKLASINIEKVICFGKIIMIIGHAFGPIFRIIGAI